METGRFLPEWEAGRADMDREGRADMDREGQEDRVRDLDREGSG